VLLQAEDGILDGSVTGVQTCALPICSSAGRELWAARLNTLAEPLLIQWAAHTGDLASLARKALAAGIAIEDPREGARARPDGREIGRATCMERNGIMCVEYMLQLTLD